MDHKLAGKSFGINKAVPKRSFWILWWSLRMFRAKENSSHSPLTFSLPRSRNRRKSRSSLSNRWIKIGWKDASVMCWYPNQLLRNDDEKRRINMKTLPIEMKENGIRYILHGDYYLQNLILPETRKRPIGRYGRMRQDRKKLFLKMGLSGQLPISFFIENITYFYFLQFPSWFPPHLEYNVDVSNC